MEMRAFYWGSEIQCCGDNTPQAKSLPHNSERLFTGSKCEVECGWRQGISHVHASPTSTQYPFPGSNSRRSLTKSGAPGLYRRHVPPHSPAS